MTMYPSKTTIYMPDDMLKEILTVAGRRDRSASYVMRKAWEIARLELIESSNQSRASAHGGALEQ